MKTQTATNTGLNRRSAITLGSASGLGLIGLLSACTSKTVNGITTVTIDVDRVNTDGNAMISALSAILLTPQMVVALGPNLVIAQAALVAAKLALQQFDTQTKGKLTLTTNTTTAVALIGSLISDAQTILALVQGSLSSLTTAVANRVTYYVTPAIALVSFLQIAVGLAGAKGVTPPMGEADAVKRATH